MAKPELLRRLEGTVPTRVKMGRTYRCDQCLNEMGSGDVVTLYFSDEDYRGRHEFARFSRAYCSECNRTEIVLPKLGAVEGMVVARFDDEMAFREVQLIDKSLSDEGVDWDPRALWNLFMGVPLDAYMEDTETGDMTSQHIADMLLSLDIDPREILDEDGELTLSDEEKLELIEQVEEKRPENVEEFKDKLGGS